jgi:hypothetical protein
MKTIAVYFSATDGSSPPKGKPDYVEAYRVFSRTIAGKGGKLLVLRGKETALGERRFSEYWELNGDEWIQRKEECAPDVVFIKDRDFPSSSGAKRVNSLEFEDLCSYKDKTYAVFPDVFPKTVLIGAEAELEAALAQIDGETIVAKPADGACGRDVFIGKREDLKRDGLPYPLLLQECIEMSQGIPGLCAGPHDLRIVMVGERIALCTLRTPKEGSLIANAAQGGTIHILPRDRIPAEALAIALEIDRRLQHYPERVYSVDMGLHLGAEWKVIELNAPPGLTPATHPEVIEYYDILADHLLKMAA